MCRDNKNENENEIIYSTEIPLDCSLGSLVNVLDHIKLKVWCCSIKEVEHTHHINAHYAKPIIEASFHLSNG